MRVASIILVLCSFLAACGGPVATATPDAAATQTRVVELAMLATASAPTVTPTVVPTSTSTLVPTNTPTLLPTATPTATRPPTETRTPTPLPPTRTPTPAKNVAPITREQAKGQFPVLTDPREVDKSPTSYTNKPLAFVGVVFTIRTASPGNVFAIEGFEASTYLQVNLFDLATNRDSGVIVVVLYDGDTAGLFKDDVVTVYATGKGTHSFQNSLGGTVTQALFYAAFVDYGQ
jgi:hypothetical protein